MKGKRKPKAYLPKSTRVARMQDVRQIVIKAMSRAGLKAYGLAKLTGLTEQAIRSYVLGDTDMRGEKLAKLFAALGLEIRPNRRKRNG